MTEYRQIQGTDVWHYLRTCSRWPGHSYESVRLRGRLRPATGELCDECKAKEAKVDKNKKKEKRRKRERGWKKPKYAD